MVIGSGVEQCRLSQKHPQLESELDCQADGNWKHLRLESQFDSQPGGDTKQSATSLQFEMLSTLVQEIREMKTQLGRFVTDFAEKQELAGGLVNISQNPCRMCGRASTHCTQDDESQLLLRFTPILFPLTSFLGQTHCLALPLWL